MKTSVNLEVHPAALLFPLMGEEELGKLADDIAANGLMEPVVLYHGQILDGRNRLAACELGGVGAGGGLRRRADGFWAQMHDLAIEGGQMIGDLLEARLLLIKAETTLSWLCPQSATARKLCADIEKFLTFDPFKTASENEDAGAGAEASSAPEQNGAVTDPGLLIARTPFAAREDRDKPPCPPVLCNPERPSIVKARKV